jgi:hypothetical protein
MVVAIDGGNNMVQTHYTPDDSLCIQTLSSFSQADFWQYQRFRSYTYGKNSLYINEATAQILETNEASKDFLSAADLASWFTTDSSGNITSLDSSQTPVFLEYNIEYW